ncbi:MAG TPA: histidine--tRNA ligase [Elusimicrobiales bacterium]|nr:histidine--tRNA ligase [Elusimicrobiales bacterium]
MIKSLRGFRDILYPESKKFTEFENIARRVMDAFGYKEIRVPVMEQKELFIKSTGETSDIVSKEMYTLEDAGGRNLALRPEATPGIVRAYLENGLYNTQPVQKLFCIGNMFRAERPQKGRYREFEQIDVEYIGNPNPSADAEVIILLDKIFKQAQVEGYTIELNSLGCPKCRPPYREKLLSFLKQNEDKLCENCVERIEKNPLRSLDCKTDKLWLRDKAPKMKLCLDCENQFNQVQELLTASGLKFKFNPNMVRGLDYYSKTVFEFKSVEIGSQDAIAGGGRYDSLIKSMGGPDIPSIGWAMGVERVLSIIKKEPKAVYPLAFVISADKEGQTRAFVMMQELQNAEIQTGGGLFSQSLKSQMRVADKTNAKYALILGEEEIKSNSVTVKNLKSGSQEKIARDKIINFLEKNK